MRHSQMVQRQIRLRLHQPKRHQGRRIRTPNSNLKKQSKKSCQKRRRRRTGRVRRGDRRQGQRGVERDGSRGRVRQGVSLRRGPQARGTLQQTWRRRRKGWRRGRRPGRLQAGRTRRRRRGRRRQRGRNLRGRTASERRHAPAPGRSRRRARVPRSARLQSALRAARRTQKTTGLEGGG